MSTDRSTPSIEFLLEIFSPQLVEDWFRKADKPSLSRRNRRLTPLVLFLGMTLYATKGLKNLQHAFGDALASIHPNLPPETVSKGSLTPARRRFPLKVLCQGHRQCLDLAQQCSSKVLLGKWRVLCIDGTTFTVADSSKNELAY